jgi:hypothetical protein
MLVVSAYIAAGMTSCVRFNSGVESKEKAFRMKKEDALSILLMESSA